MLVSVKAYPFGSVAEAYKLRARLDKLLLRVYKGLSLSIPPAIG